MLAVFAWEDQSAVAAVDFECLAGGRILVVVGLDNWFAAEAVDL